MAIVLALRPPLPRAPWLPRLRLGGGKALMGVGFFIEGAHAYGANATSAAIVLAPAAPLPRAPWLTRLRLVGGESVNEWCFYHRGSSRLQGRRHSRGDGPQKLADNSLRFPKNVAHNSMKSGK